MKIIVLGATGTLGAKIARHLTAAGHEVIAASRSRGVDAYTGGALEEVLTDADVAIDCLNIETLGKRKAMDFFSTTSRNVVEAARRVGIGHMICVCIAGASDTKVNAFNGYYQGKAIQEKNYRESGVPVTLIHSTQWFELVDSIVRRASLGPVTVLPTMRMASVAADSVAGLVAEVAAQKPPTGIRDIAIRGPEIATGVEMARTILATRGSVGGRRPRILRQLPYLGRATATDGLIPTDAIVDDVTLNEWLRSQG